MVLEDSDHKGMITEKLFIHINIEKRKAKDELYGLVSMFDLGNKHLRKLA